MSDLDWKVVPIEEWPGELLTEHKRHPFRVQRSDASYRCTP